MKILITNSDLDLYAGTQVVVRDLALELQRLGHQPMAWSRKLGDVAHELQAHGVEVADDLRQLSSVPDVIHGQHHPLVMETLLHFPEVPAVLVCHAAKGFTEAPFYSPRIMRYVAVDKRCRARFESHSQIPARRIQMILNAVDLERFRPRNPLPLRPLRAAVFSNNASRFTHLPAIRKLAKEMGLQLEVLGRRQGKPVPDPENFLPRYDVVFAKARCALEALAVGNAVVLCDVAGAGPLVTTANFDALRPMNFGAGVLVNPVTAGVLRAELERYDPVDAALVSVRVRNEASVKAAARQWLDVYASAVEESARTRIDHSQEAAVTQSYLQQWRHEKRVEWAKAQFRRIRSIPLVGTGLHHLGRRAARAWTKNPEL